jgi:hypothetical protein
MKKGIKFKQTSAGDKFGLLTVLNFSHYKNRRSHWNCSCECGGIGIFSKKYLTDITNPNCGCIARKVAGTLITRTDEESYKYKWNCIKNLSHYEGDCLIWDGYFLKQTPKMSFKNKVINVRRWIYFYFYPETDPKLFVCSVCSNYKCINIKHLRTSTNGK